MKIAATYLLTLAAMAAYADLPACENLVASDAWIREPPPVARVAAGYVRLENTGAEPVTITHIESDCCKHTMMHDSIADGDRVRMAHLDELTVSPGIASVFEPGARHLMLMSPQAPLRAGDTVTLELFCADDRSVQVPFEVIRQR